MNNTVIHYCARVLMTGLVGVEVGEQGTLIVWDKGECVKWRLATMDKECIGFSSSQASGMVASSIPC